MKKIKVGTVITHKGINYEVKGVETSNDGVVTVKLLSANGKASKLTSTNALFEKFFGAPAENVADPETVDLSEFKKPAKGSEDKKPVDKTVAKKPEPEFDDEDEDDVVGPTTTSKRSGGKTHAPVETDDEDEVEAPAPKKAEAKPAKAEKPAKAKKPEPEPEPVDPTEIDWDLEHPLLTAYLQYEEADAASRLTIIWSWTKIKELEPLAKLTLFAGYMKTLSNYDYDTAIEMLYGDSKFKSDVKTLADVDFGALAALIGKTSKKKKLTDADYVELFKFVPTSEIDQKLFLQMILDGCFVAYGYTTKGIKDSIIQAVFKDVYLIDLPANK